MPSSAAIARRWVSRVVSACDHLRGDPAARVAGLPGGEGAGPIQARGLFAVGGEREILEAVVGGIAVAVGDATTGGDVAAEGAPYDAVDRHGGAGRRDWVLTGQEAPPPTAVTVMLLGPDQALTRARVKAAHGSGVGPSVPVQPTWRGSRRRPKVRKAEPERARRRVVRRSPSSCPKIARTSCALGPPSPLQQPRGDDAMDQSLDLRDACHRRVWGMQLEPCHSTNRWISSADSSIVVWVPSRRARPTGHLPE